MSERKQTAADAGWAEVVAACALSAVPGLGATALARMAKRFEDSLTKAMKAGPEKLLSLAEELELRQPAIDFLRREPDLEELGLWAVAAAKAAGARVILLGDECYPTLLRQIENPPPLLYASRRTCRASRWSGRARWTSRASGWRASSATGSRAPECR